MGPFFAHSCICKIYCSITQCGKAASIVIRIHFILYPCLFVCQVSKRFKCNLITEENDEYCFQKSVDGEVKELFDFEEKLNQDSSFIYAKSAMLTFTKARKKSKSTIFRF